MGSEADRLFAATGAPKLTAFFGVPVFFFPGSGAPREIQAILDPVREENQETEGQELEYERMWVTVWRDEDCVYGGIAMIEVGDALEREDDDSTCRWSWQQQVRNETADTWDLLFARKRPRRLGPRQ